DGLPAVPTEPRPLEIYVSDFDGSERHLTSYSTALIRALTSCAATTRTMTATIGERSSGPSVGSRPRKRPRYGLTTSSRNRCRVPATVEYGSWIQVSSTHARMQRM